ncbi:unnamed protein product [Psylliodes chrysocephalus]|uniref:UDP-glucuronosyltransferase n=1 Tax=Psylliodes chrysocephalus TaxID=3402493 RepID=A0A9P0CJK5_9CUCU|nr:unnamed protein product [Psylliodes chrysocephala]
MHSSILFIFLCFLVNITSGFRVLIVSPIPSRSHYNLCRALVDGLTKAGHDVTFVTPFEDKPPPGNGSFKVVNLANCMAPAPNAVSHNYFQMEQMNPFFIAPLTNDLGEKCVKATFESEDVKKFLQSNQHFDAVIVESLFTDGLAAFACHFNAELITLSPLGAVQWINDVIGNPTPSSYVPNVFLGFSEHMNFWERSQNYLISLITSLSHKFLTYPKHDDLVRKHFPNCPCVEEMNRNVALILSNSHESISPTSPRVPNIVDIGGFHISPTSEKLPVDLQKLLDGAKDGVIYFSLGSHVKPSQMTLEMKHTLIKVLGSLNQTVLWKWDDDSFPEGKPNNIIVKKWFPQQQILAHPNTKLFITQAGLLSLSETIYIGVPILAMPVVADQKSNAARAELLGIGKSLLFSNLNEESFSSVLNEILTNPKYLKTVKHRSKIYKDRPIHPLDLAVYWIEYVIRHKGAPHLRVVGKDLPWYQYYCVDVVSLWIGLSLFPLYIIYKLFSTSCCRNKKKKIKQS